MVEKVPAPLIEGLMENRKDAIKAYKKFLKNQKKENLEKACQSFDFRNEFGTIRKQYFRGLCWAFAATELLEQKICQRSPEHCDLRLSPIDLARAFPGEMKDGLNLDDGGRPALALFDALEHGICTENKTYYPKGFKTIRKIKKVFHHIQRHQSTHSDLCLSSLNLNHLPQESSPELKKLFKELEKLFQYLSKKAQKRHLDLTYSKDTFATHFHEAHEKMVLQNLLIDPHCSGTRIGKDELPFIWKNLRPGSRFLIHGESYHQQIEKITQEARENRSAIILNFCANKVQSLAKVLSAVRLLGPCGGHSIVINAVRFNKKTKQCEGHFKNSWFPGGKFFLNGWMDLKPFLKHSESINFLHEEK